MLRSLSRTAPTPRRSVDSPAWRRAVSPVQSGPRWADARVHRSPDSLATKRKSSPFSMIKRIATAVVLIPLVLLLVLKAPLVGLAMVAGAVALLAIAEFLKLVTLYA